MPRRRSARRRGVTLSAVQGPYGHDDPPERAVGDCGERRVPRRRGGGQADPAAGLDDVRVGSGVADPQQEERHREQNEHERDRGGRPQRRDEHVRREDAPRDEEQPDGVSGVRLRDALLEELHEGPERQPEGAVGREGHGTERVAGPELPHAGQELRQAAVGQGEAEDDRLATAADQAGVEHAENEGRQREGGEAERAGIRDRGRDELHPLGGSPARRGLEAPLGGGSSFHEIPSRLEVLVPVSPVTIDSYGQVVRYRTPLSRRDVALDRSGAPLALLLLRRAVLAAGRGRLGTARAGGRGRRGGGRAAPPRARALALVLALRRVALGLRRRPLLTQLLLARPRLRFVRRPPPWGGPWAPAPGET